MFETIIQVSGFVFKQLKYVINDPLLRFAKHTSIIPSYGTFNFNKACQSANWTHNRLKTFPPTSVILTRRNFSQQKDKCVSDDSEKNINRHRTGTM